MVLKFPQLLRPVVRWVLNEPCQQSNVLFNSVSVCEFR